MRRPLVIASRVLRHVLQDISRQIALPSRSLAARAACQGATIAQALSSPLSQGVRRAGQWLFL